MCCELFAVRVCVEYEPSKYVRLYADADLHHTVPFLSALFPPLAQCYLSLCRVTSSMPDKTDEVKVCELFKVITFVVWLLQHCIMGVGKTV